jgi:hypothetical protein
MAAISGQGRFAFAQVISDVLAQLIRIAIVVQHIINHLEGRSQCLSIFRAALLHRRAGLGEHSPELCAGFEKASLSWTE